MNKRTPKLETLVNVAILVVAVAICAVLFKQYFMSAPPPRPHGPTAGSKVALPDVDLSAEGATLLLVLQADCHFCTESAPFYQTLAREAAARDSRVRLVAAFPRDLEGGRSYLKDLAVPILHVTQTPLRALGVTGTPTLILLNRDTIKHAWVGKLSPDEEAEVLSKL